MNSLEKTVPAPDGDITGLDMLHGVVISDLHMFAVRSRAEYVVERLHGALADADLLVLNGDIFDFRWTRLATVDDTFEEAVQWLDDLAHQFPQCRIHFVLGNHDCDKGFTFKLSRLAARTPNLAWHPDFLHVGRSVFLHGDCIHRSVARGGLDAYRKPWKNVKKKSRAENAFYRVIHETGITRNAPKVVFRRRRLASRILAYLESREPGISSRVDDVFIGHTHVPFTAFLYEGIHFHNTGTAVHRRQFNLLKFQVDN